MAKAGVVTGSGSSLTCAEVVSMGSRGSGEASESFAFPTLSEVEGVGKIGFESTSFASADLLLGCEVGGAEGDVSDQDASPLDLSRL